MREARTWPPRDQEALLVTDRNPAWVAYADFQEPFDGGAEIQRSVGSAFVPNDRFRRKSSVRPNIFRVSLVRTVGGDW